MAIQLTIALAGRPVDLTAMSVRDHADMLDALAQMADSAASICNMPRSRNSFTGDFFGDLHDDCNNAADLIADNLKTMRPATPADADAKTWALLRYECRCGNCPTDIAGIGLALAAEAGAVRA